MKLLSIQDSERQFRGDEVRNDLVLVTPTFPFNRIGTDDCHQVRSLKVSQDEPNGRSVRAVVVRTDFQHEFSGHSMAITMAVFVFILALPHQEVTAPC